jgi:putative metalloprotease
MKKTIFTCIAMCGILGAANAQFKLNNKTVGAAEKGLKAATFSDEDAAALAKKSVEWMDAHNPVADEKDPYAIRLNKIFGNHKNEDGLTLNYKVYKVTDINAFACADGSIRVFSSLMDIMTDEELLAVIGHEIGHVKNHDTRDAIRAAYKRAAVSDAAASQSGVVNSLTESQLGEIANAMLDSKYSRKQESEADDYGYNFMKKHKYNVMAMASAFKKLQSLGSGAKQSSMQKMLSSHPDSGERAKSVEEKAKKDGLYK